jgi:hypothetical protein
MLGWMGWYGLDKSGSGYGPVEGCCKHGNEPSGCIKCWEILERLVASQEGLGFVELFIYNLVFMEL